MNIDLIKKNTFTIKHSPGSITYTMTGFRLKNSDKVDAEI
jgi:myosin heavy subunit